MIVYTSRNEALTLADKAMSSGGEGEIHTVLSKPSRFDNVCVKIYYRTKRNVQLEKKLRYMSANPPKQISLEGILIAWPQEVVYDQQKNFLGFVMPLAFSNSQKLAVLTSKKLYKNLTPEWAGKFDRQLGGASIAARLRLICNIAISVHLLHSTGKYVLRDFKPDNVLVTYEGKVALVDMDSLQIAEENNRFLPKMLFPANTGGTPDYMPPEYYNRKVGKNAIIPIAKTWDYFSIAVVFYQILFGLHPYMVTPRVEKDSESNELYPNIAQNLFPFGANAAKISSYPSLHLNFKRIPSKLQDLFVRAFSDDTSIRPTPEEWVKTIKEIIRKAPKVSPNLHSDEAKQMADTLYFEQNQSTKKGLKRYLNRYPEGLHAQDAENLLRLRKWNRNVVFIILLVCSLLIAIMFYDMIRRGSSQESESSGYEVPEFGEAVDSAEVDSSLMDSVRTDTIVAPAPVEVEDSAYTDSISLDYGCEFAGKVEDSNGIPREIYGVLTVCDISEVSGFYYYKSSAKKVGVEDSKIFFKGRAWAGADGEGSYEISMSALFRDGTPPEHWEGMLYIGNDESAFNGRIRDHNGVRYTVSFIGDNYY